MYKSQLQVLCQRRQWALPEYAVTRDGPDHSPCFMASVTVNGDQFSSPTSASSSKEAQNKAAQVAFEKFSSAAPPPAPSLPRASFSQPSLVTEACDAQMYKSQLQVFCQRRHWALPEYIVTRDGPDHHPRFLASVVVNGEQFSASAPSNSSKEAHNKAAQVALEKLSAAPPSETSLTRSSSSCPTLVTEASENQHSHFHFRDGPSQQDDPGFYKNLLQELTQKEGISFPKYNTVSEGQSHLPVFFSSVEIEGERFEGEVAKTKKQAETNAAKVAWNALKDRKLSRLASRYPPNWHVEELELPSSVAHLYIQKPITTSSPKVDKELELPSSMAHLNIQSPITTSSPKVDKELEVPSSMVHPNIQKPITISSPKVDKNNLITDNHVAATLELADVKNTSFMTKNMNDNCFNNLQSAAPTDEDSSLKKYDASITTQKSNPVTSTENEIALDNKLLKEGSSFPSRKTICSNHAVAAEITGNSTEDSACPSLFSKVQVYPHKPEMVLPEGGVILPFSDDTWVALGLGAQ